MDNRIGELNEQPLHAALKAHYCGRVGRLEENVDGYFIDVLRENKLIEVQTQNFYAIKSKIIELTNSHEVKLVYPIASEKWLLKISGEKGCDQTRRKSPKRGKAFQLFSELVSFPELIAKQNFSLDIVMADIEELRRYTGKRPWRQNGWETVEQRLIRIIETITIEEPEDLLALFPETLPVKFTTADLEKEACIPRWLAQKAAYCLRKSGAVQKAGKEGRFNLYSQKSVLEE